MVQKSGSFFSYGDERLGQGRNNVKGYLRENPQVARRSSARSTTRSAWSPRRRSSVTPPRRQGVETPAGAALEQAEERRRARWRGGAARPRKP